MHEGARQQQHFGGGSPCPASLQSIQQAAPPMLHSVADVPLQVAPTGLHGGTGTEVQ